MTHDWADWADWLAEVYPAVDAEEWHLLLAYALSELEVQADENIGEAEARVRTETMALRAEIGGLRRDFRSVRASLADARQSHAETAAKAQAHIAALERARREMVDETRELRKAIGVLMKDLAAERALRKTLSAYNSRTHAERVAAEITRRRAMKAGDTAHGHARSQ